MDDYPDDVETFGIDGEQTFEGDVAELVAIATKVAKECKPTFLPGDLHARFLEAISNVEAWNEDSDPRSMGWVDDKGRP